MTDEGRVLEPSQVLRCIYCLKLDDGTADRAHTFPEAVVENRFILPQGAICRGCNSYFKELDTTLAQHPFIALPIQFLAVPGKGARTRRVVGGIKQVYDQFTGKRYIEYRTEEPTMSRDRRGGRSLSYTPYVDGSFDIWKFRRALHYVALNATAHGIGVEFAHQPRFDAVRRYVRFPNRRTENWPYLQTATSFLRVRDEVDVQGFHDDTADFVVIRFFNTDFGVDLRNSGRLQEIASGRMPPGSTVVDSTYKPSRSPKSERQYRITMEVRDGRVGQSTECPSLRGGSQNK